MFYALQRIEIQKVEKTYLYLTWGHLREGQTEHTALYLLRVSDGMVPLPNSIAEANESLPSFFEIGVLTGHSLLMLEQLLIQVGIF